MLYWIITCLVVMLLINQGTGEEEWKKWFNRNTEENVEKLSDITDDELAEEYSGQYQGDIVMSPEQMETYKNGKSSERNGLVEKRYRWNQATVPYRIMERFYSYHHIEYIKEAMIILSEVSCIKFVPYNPMKHRDFITIQGSQPGCFSQVGRQKGEQILNLQPHRIDRGCFRLYSIVHELMHTLGFLHMQSSTNRDQFVEIKWDKIVDAFLPNFEKYGADLISDFNVGYDYGSLMHYSPKAFSIDGSPTIISIGDPENSMMGQRVRLSEKDIRKLNKMYCEQTDLEVLLSLKSLRASKSG